MRTALLLVGLCLLLTVPAASAGVHIHGEAAGTPFSVGPTPDNIGCNFQYQTVDFGVFYSHGGGPPGCTVYVRAL